MDTSDKDRSNPTYSQVGADGPYLYSYEFTSYNVNGSADLGFTTIIDNVSTHRSYPFKSSMVRSPATKMMGVEPVASIITSPMDEPSIDNQTWVAQCGRWEPFGTTPPYTTLNNYLSIRHNKRSDSCFGDGHAEAVGQNYATNYIYSLPSY